MIDNGGVVGIQVGMWFLFAAKYLFLPMLTGSQPTRTSMMNSRTFLFLLVSLISNLSMWATYFAIYQTADWAWSKSTQSWVGVLAVNARRSEEYSPQARAIRIDNWWITFCLAFGSTITGLILLLSYRRFLSDTYRFASLATTMAFFGGTFGGWTLINFLIALPSNVDEPQCSILSQMETCPLDEDGWASKVDPKSSECCKMRNPNSNPDQAAPQQSQCPNPVELVTIKNDYEVCRLGSWDKARASGEEEDPHPSGAGAAAGTCSGETCTWTRRRPPDHATPPLVSLPAALVAVSAAPAATAAPAASSRRGRAPAPRPVGRRAAPPGRATWRRRRPVALSRLCSMHVVATSSRSADSRGGKTRCSAKCMIATPVMHSRPTATTAGRRRRRRSRRRWQGEQRGHAHPRVAEQTHTSCSTPIVGHLARHAVGGFGASSTGRAAAGGVEGGGAARQMLELATGRASAR